MVAQAGLCLAWSETSEDTFCRIVAQMVDLRCLPTGLRALQMQQLNTEDPVLAFHSIFIQYSTIRIYQIIALTEYITGMSIIAL